MQLYPDHAVIIMFLGIRRGLDNRERRPHLASAMSVPTENVPGRPNEEGK